MNQTQRLSSLMLGAAIALSGLTAHAQEMPARKPGLWKQTQYEGDKSQEATVIYQCVDETTDKQLQAMAMKMASCTEAPMKRKGNTMVGGNVCQIMGSKITTEYVVSGDMNTKYRVDSSSTNEPPLFGQAKSTSVLFAEWQGPCKPGQKPGDMIVQDDGNDDAITNMSDLEQLQEMAKTLDLLQSSHGMGQLLEQLQAGGEALDMQELGKLMDQMQKMQK